MGVGSDDDWLAGYGCDWNWVCREARLGCCCCCCCRWDGAAAAVFFGCCRAFLVPVVDVGWELGVATDCPLAPPCGVMGICEPVACVAGGGGGCCAGGGGNCGWN